MFCNIIFIGKYNEASSFGKETVEYLLKLKNDFKLISKKDLEIIGSTTKVRTKVYDVEQICEQDDYIQNADILILFLNFTDSNSIDFLHQEWISDLKSINISNDQHRFLIGYTNTNFNSNSISQEIIKIMNDLKFEKYFENRSGKFFTEGQQIDSLTILPNFYQFLSNQIKQIANLPLSSSEDEVIKFTEGQLNYLLYPYTNTAKVTSSPKASGQVKIKKSVIYDSKSYIITEIDEATFKGAQIESVTFDEDSCVTRIRKLAFQDSTVLSLSIPDSLEKFEEEWCGFVVQLKEIKISGDHPHFLYENGLLIDKERHEIIFGKRDLNGHLTFPKYVKRIGSFAFNCCNQITSFTTESDEFESIGSFAFCNCGRLESFSIPKAKKLTFNRKCFSLSKKLSSTVIDENCEELVLADNCFESCESLSNLAFPAKSVTFGNMSMYGCNGVTGISIENSDSIHLGEECFSAISNLKSVSLKTKHFSVCDNSFEFCQLIRSVSLDVEDELNSRFVRDFNLLQTVELTSRSKLTITKSSLKNLAELESITLRSKELILENGCFGNCQKLSSILIECSNEIDFPTDIFEHCKALKSFKCINSDDFDASMKIGLAENCFKNAEKLEKVEITANKGTKIHKPDPQLKQAFIIR